MDDGRAIEARVHPTTIRGSLLSDVRGAFNAVHVQEGAGPTLYVGEGGHVDGYRRARRHRRRGMRESAAAAMRCHARHALEELSRPIRPIGALQCEYPTILVFDRPGVLGRIAELATRSRSLGHSEGSQTRHVGADRHPHHDALERNLRRAPAEIGRLPVVSGKPVFVRIERP